MSRITSGEASSRLAAFGKNAFRTIGDGAQDAAHASVTFVRAHPVATAGALAGVAFVVGAVAHRALQPDPTLGEVFRKTFRRGATQFSNNLASGSKRGIDRAAAALHKSFK